MSEITLLTIAETAALLHVSADTIEREIRRGIIPAKRIRSAVRISRAWLESYVAESAPILLTRRQVSRKLNVSADRVRTLQVKGLLSTVMIGRQQRIPASDLAEFLKRNTFAFLRGSHRSRGSRLPQRLRQTPVPATVRNRFSNVGGV
jgi:excisionase family DNA binding protein